MKLYLIRHGITAGNTEKVYYGSTDLPLLPQGEEELKKLKGRYPAAQKYYTSGMLRTEQSFRLLFGDQPHERIPEFRELNFGEFEMRTFKEVREDSRYMDFFEHFNLSSVYPGGESHRSVGERAMRAALRIVDDDRDALCVMHCMVICSLMRQWFPVSDRELDYYVVEPGHGYEISFENGKPVHYRNIP